MFRKFLCLVLCCVLALCITVPVFASASGDATLSASYVQFKDGMQNDVTMFPFEGTPIVASTTVSNSGTTAKAAVLWVGAYVNDVLVDVKYDRKSVPAGKSASFKTSSLTIPTGSNQDNTKIRAYVWDSFSGANAVASVANMLESAGALRDIRIDGQLIEGFGNDKYQYTYRVPYALTKRPVFTARTMDNATKVEVPDYTIPGTVSVNVTKGNGETRTFTIDLQWGPGTVSNIKNNLSSQAYRAFYNLRPQSLQGLRDLYRDAKIGPGWEEYCRGYVDRGLNATNAIAMPGVAASGGLIPDETYPLKATATGGGQYLGDYELGGGSGWLTMWLGKGVRSAAPTGTSDFFTGATWIAFGNNERAAAGHATSSPDAVTFEINRGATVYLICNLSGVANFTSNGWTESTDSKYAVVHGDGSTRTRQYIKHFEPGLVQIPTTGVGNSGDRAYMPIIIWDEPAGFDNAYLSSIEYKVGSASYTSIPDFNAEIDVYDITLNSFSVPEVKATAADSRADVKISYPDTLPGTATIQVTAVDGTKKYYAVNFFVDQPDGNITEEIPNNQ